MSSTSASTISSIVVILLIFFDGILNAISQCRSEFIKTFLSFSLYSGQIVTMSYSFIQRKKKKQEERKKKWKKQGGWERKKNEAWKEKRWKKEKKKNERKMKERKKDGLRKKEKWRMNGTKMKQRVTFRVMIPSFIVGFVNNKLIEYANQPFIKKKNESKNREEEKFLLFLFLLFLSFFHFPLF